MKCSPSILALIASSLQASLSSDSNTRRSAEQSLSSPIAEPDFAHALLAIACSSYKDEIRIAAARHLKNLICSRWPRPGGSSDHLPASDCSIIQEGLLDALFKVPVQVQAELSEAMAAAAALSFRGWKFILSDIVDRLIAASREEGVDNWDLTSTRTALVAALSVVSRFQDTMCDTEDQDQLRYCVHTLAPHLHRVSSTLQAAATVAGQLKVQCLGLCCRIFYALGSAQQQQPDVTNAQQEPHVTNPGGMDIPMPDVIANTLVLETCWLPLFFSILRDPNLNIPGQDFDAVHAAAIDNIRLFMEKDFDNFSAHLDDFLVVLRADLHADAAKVGTIRAALRSLIYIAETRALWSNLVGYITFICEAVALLLQICKDVKLFETDWMEYVSKENRNGTLSCYACQLVQGIAVIKGAEVAQFLLGEISKMKTPNADWKQSDI